MLTEDTLPSDGVTRFAIICMGRTGSTWLGELLNSHPQIECRGELFAPSGDFEAHAARGIDRRRYLQHDAFTTDRPIRGFKMPYPWAGDYPGVFDDFRALNYKVIRLSRRSLLDHYVSIQLAHRNDNWDSTKEHREQQMEVDPFTLLTFSGQRLMAEEMLGRMSTGLPTESAEYADLHLRATHQRLLSFLGANDHPLTTPTRRVRSLPTAQAVTNYREVVAFFRKRGIRRHGAGLSFADRMRLRFEPETPEQMGL